MANVAVDSSWLTPIEHFAHKSGLFHEPGPTLISPDLFHPPRSNPSPDPFAIFQDLPNMLPEKKLHWTQRVALIRHNLHAASRTGDFTFFKTLQAHRLLEGTDHLAALNAVIGDAADQVLASLDNYNSVMAYVHEDAFKNVYESVKTGVREQAGSYDDRRAIYYVDAAQQKEKAEKAIDKMINSAITMINAQPVNCQEEAANVWIWGTTFVADAMEVCLAQVDAIEACLDDFIRLENAWSVVQSAVGASIGAIKGIFNLMAPCEAPEAQQHRSDATEGTVRSMLRRMSTAMTSGMNSAAPSRRQSVMSVSNTMPPVVPLQHGSVQTGPPLRGVGWRSSALKHSRGPMELMPTIPPTPAAAMLNTNPFDTSFNGNNSNFSVGEDMPPPPTAPPPTAHFSSHTGSSANSNNASHQQQQTSGGPSSAGRQQTAQRNFSAPTATTTSSSNTNNSSSNNNNTEDIVGSPGSTTTSSVTSNTSNGVGGGSGKTTTTTTTTRPRSANVQDNTRPVFDDMLFSM
ncbi:uncharacterized protein BKCO1_7000185 [Diplodia corticola]|uniref:Uncharacterized protein n=1 Tax=Diplodia corticola TaxID=236234 RepID=A0A1J9RAK7_9PEZI|nr:uncharacterized protein BKCO1_7000185 [Diplodia corticola]OJD37505.1 hypothetical protein BKCO1_7000185 [Diplodia corticola]